MESILDLLNQRLDDGAVSSISNRIGADRVSTQNALSTAVPLLLTALARNASEPEGAESLREALVRDHSGAVLSNVSGLVSQPEAANGKGILRHTLGDRRGAVEQAVAAKSGLDVNSIGPLLEIVAPLVMGALGMTTQQNGLDSSGLSSLLSGQRDAVQESQPDLMGMIGSLLGGSGGQGDAVGDVLGDLLGGPGADQPAPGDEPAGPGDTPAGGLGGLLGKLLGGR